ncbi:MAG TPA: hypothetical protein DCK93_10310, partial [Blastocatellia bacterium]|nr:hypothetical protein [Blastocatellia bacterium]
SDFEWTWARFSREDGSLPEELVLIGGQSLLLDGKAIFKSGKRISYLAARRAGNQFQFDITDEEENSGLRTSDLEIGSSKLEIRNSKS